MARGLCIFCATFHRARPLLNNGPQPGDGRESQGQGAPQALVAFQQGAEDGAGDEGTDEDASGEAGHMGQHIRVLALHAEVAEQHQARQYRAPARGCGADTPAPREAGQEADGAEDGGGGADGKVRRTAHPQFVNEGVGQVAEDAGQQDGEPGQAGAQIFMKVWRESLRNRRPNPSAGLPEAGLGDSGTKC